MWALSEVRRSLRRVLMPGELEVLTAPVRHVQEGAYRPGWLTVTEQRLVEHSVFHPFPLSIPWSQVPPVEVGQAAVPERADEHELLSREARLRLAAAPAHDEAHLRLTTPAMAGITCACCARHGLCLAPWSKRTRRPLLHGLVRLTWPIRAGSTTTWPPWCWLCWAGRCRSRPRCHLPVDRDACRVAVPRRPSWALSLLCLAGDERDLAARQGLLLAANLTQLRCARER